MESSIALVKAKLGSDHAYGFLAEDRGQILGSIFLNVFPGTPVTAIGPLSADSAVKGGVGRRLMEAALEQSRKRGFEAVRLVQSPSHLRSLALYTKSGFAVREPLVLVHGRAREVPSQREHLVRLAASEDVEACNNIAPRAHGFARKFELSPAIDSGWRPL